ncbi:hypothetical protein V6667_06400 [Neisseria leonii]|uniref:Uncharacterized protein n=1 Tax=Neisseria leonii TaxID=2995413 RepID=A0A9X4E1F6_9NEIS|nr:MULTISPECIES: hypothetical protein [unclassified Neisseria]MDD9324729.1 hypothetical protein [Neisseria sp. 3986]MDD9327708.1 hypothetical protein [Neisseria sp. 51.81]
MSNRLPDCLLKQGIVRVSDNLDGGCLKPQPRLLAQLFGDVFADYLHNKPPANTESEKTDENDCISGRAHGAEHR